MRRPMMLTVAGVHSGKFVNERVTQNIARACDRLGVHHPVLNDRQFRTWRKDADDRVCIAAERDVAADDPRIASEAILPETSGSMARRTHSGFPRCSSPW